MLVRVYQMCVQIGGMSRKVCGCHVLTRMVVGRVRFELTITAVSRRYPNRLDYRPVEVQDVMLALLTFNRIRQGHTERGGTDEQLRKDFSEEEKRGFYKAVYSRRDVRSHFVQDQIGDDVLFNILNAAHHAPSVGFSQPWNFILIRDAITRAKIKESFEEEKERSSRLVEEPKRSQYTSFKLEGIMESSINLCVTYDPSKFGPFVIGRSSIPEAGLYSVCCAIQNLWLSARAEGVGMGWVSILSNETLRNVLDLPEHVVPVAYLCLGYVDEFAQKPDLETAGWLPRLGLKDVVYFERWNDKDDENWNGIREVIGGDER